ncbi:hypothetical protein B0T17DRAFT_465070, partial [Bombardia bombarda]
DDNDDDYDEIPLQNQRPFGSGLHKKTIAFVPATADNGRLNSTNKNLASTSARPHLDVADLYLSMVLSKDKSQLSKNDAREESSPLKICDICRLPLESAPTPGQLAETKHESSLAHQVCIPHSHPPSALDRSRMGLSILSSQGWDPDARRGLGAAQQGIQYPVKARPKDDKLGLGIQVPKNLPPPKKKQEKLLDAKKVRKMAREEARRAERIRQSLYGRDDLERYLGPGADG